VVIFGSSQLIRHILEPISEKLENDNDNAEGLANAGKQIGWLERFLVLTAVVFNQPTSVVLIIAAKSIYRFPESKGRPHADYFIIGTFLSISIAIIGGLLLMAVIKVSST
jgi:hypothetical protein